MNAPFQPIYIRTVPTTLRSNGSDSQPQTVVASVGHMPQFLNLLQPHLQTSNGRDLAALTTLQRPLQPHQSQTVFQQQSSQRHPFPLVKSKEEQVQLVQIMTTSGTSNAVATVPLATFSAMPVQFHRPIAPSTYTAINQGHDNLLASISQKLLENMQKEMTSLNNNNNSGKPIIFAPQEVDLAVYQPQPIQHIQFPRHLPATSLSQSLHLPQISTAPQDKHSPPFLTQAQHLQSHPQPQVFRTQPLIESHTVKATLSCSPSTSKTAMSSTEPGHSSSSNRSTPGPLLSNTVQSSKIMANCSNKDATSNPQKWKSLIRQKYELEAYSPVLIDPSATTPITIATGATSPLKSEPSLTPQSNGEMPHLVQQEPPKKRRKLTTEHVSPLSGAVRKSSLISGLPIESSTLAPQPDFLQTNSLDAWPKLAEVGCNGICLQYNSCNDFKIKSKCLSCRSRKHDDEESKLFCRFVGFQILQSDSKSGKQVGFADWQMSDECSQALWIPQYPVIPSVTEEQARHILKFVFPHFCAIVGHEWDMLGVCVDENEVHVARVDSLSHNMTIIGQLVDKMASMKRPLWRRVVEITRETCDVCETSIFNLNWSCVSCGYIVCSDCYRTRKIRQPVKQQTTTTGGEKASITKTNSPLECKDGDETKEQPPKAPRQRRQRIVSGLHTWAYCTTNRMEHDLRLTQLIPGLLLWQVSQWIHRVLADKMLHSDNLCPCLPQQGHTNTTSKRLTAADVDPLSLLASVVLGQQKPLSEREMSSNTNNNNKSSQEVAHSFITNRIPPTKVTAGKEETSTPPPSSPARQYLWLHSAFDKGNLALFQDEWRNGRPVLVSQCHSRLDPELWKPRVLCAGKPKVSIVDCVTNSEAGCDSFAKFWDGFQSMRKRVKNAFWKVKDWPSKGDFSEEKPELSDNLYSSLPMPDYTQRDGAFNLVARLPNFFAQPDLGPKFYMAYGMSALPEVGTTNLHLDVADAVNVMLEVKCPKYITPDELDSVERAIRDDPFLKEEDGHVTRMSSTNPPGALWHIFAHSDTATLRAFLLKRHPYYKSKRKLLQQLQSSSATVEQHATDDNNADVPGEPIIYSPPSKKLLNVGDPVHDQLLYLSADLLQQLYEEEGVQAYSILQFKGDAIFIPAGCSHQVRNLHSCVKAAVDFVSPEHIDECLQLTEEFRCLPKQNANQADKLQVKNMLYHTVKDCGAVLYSTSITSTDSTNSSTSITDTV